MKSPSPAKWTAQDDGVYRLVPSDLGDGDDYGYYEKVPNEELVAALDELSEAQRKERRAVERCARLGEENERLREAHARLAANIETDCADAYRRGYEAGEAAWIDGNATVEENGPLG